MIELGEEAGTSPSWIRVQGQAFWPFRMGLQPQMKGTADHLAENGFVALAPDLYRGELAGHDDGQGRPMDDQFTRTSWRRHERRRRPAWP